MKSGMAKETCTMFDISAKHLSKILSGKKYAGGGDKKRKTDTKTPGLKGCKKKCKLLKSHTAHKDPDESSSSSDDDEDDNRTHQYIKDRPHWMVIFFLCTVVNQSIYEHLSSMQLMYLRLISSACV